MKSVQATSKPDRPVAAAAVKVVALVVFLTVVLPVNSRFPVHGSGSATRDLAVGRLDDLGGVPNCLVPDSGSGSARARSAAWRRPATEGRRSMAVAAPQRW